MASSDIKSVRQRTYLAKDMAGFQAQILDYARRFYPDKIKDLSESSTGGLFLDMASIVGDNLSFYLDHQYNELDPDTAVETQNIERLLRSAGVPITGAAPAIVDPTIYIEVPATSQNGRIVPDPTSVPVVQANSVWTADNGVDFVLIEDVDFTKLQADQTYLAQIKVGQRSVSNVPQTFIMALAGRCVSGRETTETFMIGSDFVPFRRLTLSNPDVSEIISVSDDLGNVYRHVSALTHDVVYQNVLNTNKDRELVQGTLKVIPAPYRFVEGVDLGSRRSTLTFGGGNADTLEDDIIPDPSEFAISLPYTKTFSRIPVNPEKLLTTKTLGVAATNTVLSVTYRHGGGLSHNVGAGAIRNIKTLKMVFPNGPSNTVAASVRSSTEVSNAKKADGGDDAPDIDELKALIPAMRGAQERVVSRPDLLARVYSLPSNFGRVFRAAVRSNPNNPISTQLYVISRTSDNRLVTSPDTLKDNLVKYLNPYRMIADAVDILDSPIVNLSFTFDVIVDPTLNSKLVVQSVLVKLKNMFNIKRWHIDQPIITSDVTTAIKATNGVIAVNSFKFANVTGVVNGKTYSDVTFDVAGNTKNSIIFPPSGGIFEVRYPDSDLVGKVTG